LVHNLYTFVHVMISNARNVDMCSLQHLGYFFALCGWRNWRGWKAPSETALSYFAAIPQSWGLRPDDMYPNPIVPADIGRKIALAAYETRKG